MTLPSTKDKYEYLAKQIEREDGLINTRISWLLTFEGFLFAAFGIMSKEPSSIQSKILWLIPIAGFSMSFLAMLGINAAISALNNLKKQWEGNFCGYIQPFGNDNEHKSAVTYSRGIPILLMGIWLIIELYTIFTKNK
jgi:hypothetical protein